MAIEAILLVSASLSLEAVLESKAHEKLANTIGPQPTFFVVRGVLILIALIETACVAVYVAKYHPLLLTKPGIERALGLDSNNDIIFAG